jgi:hypothetical protein
MIAVEAFESLDQATARPRSGKSRGDGSEKKRAELRLKTAPGDRLGEKKAGIN